MIAGPGGSIKQLASRGQGVFFLNPGRFEVKLKGLPAFRPGHSASGKHETSARQSLSPRFRPAAATSLARSRSDWLLLLAIGASAGCRQLRRLRKGQRGAWQLEAFVAVIARRFAGHADVLWPALPATNSAPSASQAAGADEILGISLLIARRRAGTRRGVRSDQRMGASRFARIENAARPASTGCSLARSLAPCRPRAPTPRACRPRRSEREASLSKSRFLQPASFAALDWLSFTNPPICKF